MKIVLVNPPYLSFGGIKESGGHAVPLNLLYLAAYLRENIECDIVILDAEISELSYLDIEKRLKSEKPDVVGITCPTPAMEHVIKIAEISKKVNPNCIVVVGGPHPTPHPKQTAKIPNIDFVIIGEGEVTLSELLNAIKSKEKSFRHIDGLAYKSQDNGIILTNPRKLIEDLDTLPFPARDLVNLKLYRSAPTKKVSGEAASASLLAGRGCPYNCIHCISKVIWQRKYRARSAKNVVDEIEECIDKYGLREFNFYDDTFILIKKRVVDICSEIRRRNLNISWICFGRVNRLSRDIVQELKKAGCKKISFGLESGDQRILDIMRKGTTLDQAREAVKLCNEEGMKVHASFMIGNVGETRETVENTIKFAKELKLDNATFFITVPYPGTDLFDIALEKGYITNDTKWEDFAPITDACPILVQDNLTQADLVNFQKKAFRAFYLRPNYIFYKLSQVRSFQDVKSLFTGLNIFRGIQNKKH